MIAIIIEDSEAIRQYLKRLLTKAGYEVYSFTTFLTAIMGLSKIGDHSMVRKIISDFEIKGDLFNGIRFLDCFEDFFINAQRLILSGRDDIRDQVKNRGWEFIQKASPGWQFQLQKFIGLTPT